LSRTATEFGANYTAITPLKVIQSHQIWYQSKAHTRLHIRD